MNKHTATQFKMLAAAANSLAQAAEIASEEPHNADAAKTVRRYRHAVSDAGSFLTQSRKGG